MPAGDHIRQHQTRQPDQADEIHLQNVPFILPGLFHVGAAVTETGIIDQHVHTHPAGLNFVVDTPGRVFPGQIRRYHEHPDSVTILQFLVNLVEAVEIAGDQDQVVFFRGQQTGEFIPDPRRSPGDDGCCHEGFLCLIYWIVTFPERECTSTKIRCAAPS